MFLYFKALHIIFVVTWFAGLFYMVRLFIYQTEAYEKPEPQRSVLVAEYKRISKLLWYIIAWPSAVLTLIFGLSLLYTYGSSIPVWLWVKLGLVVLLFLYQIYSHLIFKRLQKDRCTYSSMWLRIWNEVATLLLVSIVFLVVLKNTLDMTRALLGLVIFAVLLMMGIRFYKMLRSKKE